MSAAFETPGGEVRVYRPTKPDGYWRVEWYEHGSRRQSTAGRTLETAKAKAASLVDRLTKDSQPRGRDRLSDAFERYLAWGETHWSANHLLVTRRNILRLSAQYGRLRCEQVDGRLLKDICHEQRTASQAKAERSRLRAFLVWALGEDYVTTAQKESLDSYTWVPTHKPVVRPERKPGRKTIEVLPDEMPTHAKVVALGEALQQRLPYGRLLVELAAGSGLRISELLALRAEHVVLATRRLAIREQVLGIRTAEGGRLALPKGGKQRMAIYPEQATTGYPLAEALAARVSEVVAEKKAGSNEHGLLFPALRGGYWWTTSFTNDFFTPAAVDAEWPRLSWKVPGGVRYQWVWTMHSLRHRFAQDAIDSWALTPAELTEVGGWESVEVVFQRYYGKSADLLERVFLKTKAVVAAAG